MYKPNNNTKDYKISLKSPKGNTVGFINLSKNFCNASLNTSTPDYQALAEFDTKGEQYRGKLVEYLKSLVIELESLDIEPTSPEEY